ncbi:MAG: hypothetical protein IPN96_03365 [Anaerolineales bacterium]|nr:hypothetical protein [Anaerolineales bacterium]
MAWPPRWAGKAIIPDGATGYRGSNLNAKFKAAMDHLDDVDVCLMTL